jgi:hypothetical protein
MDGWYDDLRSDAPTTFQAIQDGQSCDPTY